MNAMKTFPWPSKTTVGAPAPWSNPAGKGTEPCCQVVPPSFDTATPMPA
jgi:hypothetical protein